MKNLVKTMTAVVVIATVFVACEKEEIVTNEVDETTQTRGPILDIDPVGAPDLVVTYVNSNVPTVSPTACGSSGQQISCGGSYTLTVKVTNFGTAAVTDYYQIEVDKPTGNADNNTFMSPTGSLAPGATHTFNIGPTPFGGCSGAPYSVQDIIITADIWDEVREIKENNNVARTYNYCGD
jgi:hypothetical protein